MALPEVTGKMVVAWRGQLPGLPYPLGYHGGRRDAGIL